MDDFKGKLDTYSHNSTISIIIKADNRYYMNK